MKRTIITVAIATFLTCAIIISCAYAMPAQAEPATYNIMGIVVRVEPVFPGCEEIICKDANGETFGFFADEGDFEIGLITVVIFRDTLELEEEDEIIDYEIIGSVF